MKNKKQKEDIIMPFIGLRKIQKIGHSTYINVPDIFLQKNNLKVGDTVSVYASQDMLVSVSIHNMRRISKKVEELIHESK